MRAQAVGRLGRSDRRTWLGRVRDAVDSLVRRSPSRFAILIFAGLILIFTLLFSLPIARAGAGSGAPLHDALFTAVSVICVTGLATVDMATYWTPFGNALVFIGVNVALLVLRRQPVEHDHFKAWTALPWLGAATCAGLAVQQVVEDPKLVLWAGGLLLFGLILWFAERLVR